MIRAVAFVVPLVVFGLSALPVAANGNGAQTETIHFSGTDSFVNEEAACGVPVGAVITQEFRAVVHITEGPNGQFHITGTFQGDITIAIPGGQTYEGHFADWFGENVNTKNVASTFTSNNVLRAPDGSKLNVHFLEHFSLSASGEGTFFFRLNCGGGE